MANLLAASTSSERDMECDDEAPSDFDRVWQELTHMWPAGPKNLVSSTLKLTSYPSIGQQDNWYFAFATVDMLLGSHLYCGHCRRIYGNVRDPSPCRVDINQAKMTSSPSTRSRSGRE
jgi:hypothetical protein